MKKFPNSIKLKWTSATHYLPITKNCFEQTMSTRAITHIIEMQGKDGRLVN